MDEEQKDRKESETRPGPRPAEEQEPRVFVVGLGQTGRELIARIMNAVRVTGMDIEPRKVELARLKVSGSDVEFLLKDGTSRITWEELGLSPKDTVVCVTRRDDVNLEICRVAREYFGVKQLISLMHSSRQAEEYARLGVEVVGRALVLASFFEARILRDRRTAGDIGLGQGEIMEVPILPGSPVIGRPLSTFHARPWLVAAVYREGKLIVPHGHTVLRAGDRVVLVGEPHILSGIAGFFKMGEPEFPLQFGPRIGVMPAKLEGKEYEALIAESNYLARNTRATAVVVLTAPGLPEPDLDTAAKVCGGTGLACEPAFLPDEENSPWPKKLQEQDFGCLVIGCRKMGLLKRLGVVKTLLTRILEEADFPVLVSRGSHPYKKILVPVEPKPSSLRLAELAIDLSRLFKANLEVLTVTEPAFAAGREAVEEQKKILDQVMEHAALYQHHLNLVHREGNPIRETVRQAENADLAVIGYRRKKRSLPRLDLGIEILSRLSCSCLILPFSEEPR